MQSILVGVDDSDGSQRAVEFAASRSAINGWRLTIAHVIPWSPYAFTTLQENDERPRERAKEIDWAQSEIIERMTTSLDANAQFSDLTVATVIRHGRPNEVLIELAETDDHDMIVVGRTGSDSGLAAAIFGSTASRLVRHSPVPVVVVP